MCPGPSQPRHAQPHRPGAVGRADREAVHRRAPEARQVGIRDEILLKPGRLSTDEFEKIKEHPTIGANMLNQLGLWDRERQIIRCHHERFDGSGYPDGLRQEEIPFLARILSVADAYDAMASDRAYRKRMEEALILRIIQEGSGTQFDPLIVTAFQKAYLEGKIAAAGPSD